MLGCYDFCGHYEWTFEWLRSQGGEPLVARYWDEAIGGDSQKHAADLIQSEGFAGMKKYWDHTLVEEAAGFAVEAGPDHFRIDMHDCPSKGFLIRNGLAQYNDYCNHCIGWIKPIMEKAGFGIDHEHNHCGQCWWEFRRNTDTSSFSTPDEMKQDVRLRADWDSGKIERFDRSSTD
jgi:hypothetical protein